MSSKFSFDLLRLLPEHFRPFRNASTSVAFFHFNKFTSYWASSHNTLLLNVPAHHVSYWVLYQHHHQLSMFPCLINLLPRHIDSIRQLQYIENMHICIWMCVSRCQLINQLTKPTNCVYTFFCYLINLCWNVYELCKHSFKLRTSPKKIESDHMSQLIKRSTSNITMSIWVCMYEYFFMFRFAHTVLLAKKQNTVQPLWEEMSVVQEKWVFGHILIAP